MISAHLLRSYQASAAQTAPPGQLVLMLYDGAIRFLDLALAGFGHQDPLEFNETINNNVLHAQQVIEELNQCLDLRQGGELAITLRSLYAYMDRRLAAANTRKAPEGIEEVLQRLTTLRDAWREMLSHQSAVPDSPVLSLDVPA